MDIIHYLFAKSRTISAIDLYKRQPGFRAACQIVDLTEEPVVLDDQPKFLDWLRAVKRTNPEVCYQ